MNEEGITLYGDTYIENVPAWGNAKDILTKRGVEVERSFRTVHYKRDYWTHEMKPYIIQELGVYFSNKSGVEVAHWSPITNTLVILKTPRVWAESFLKNTVDTYREAEILAQAPFNA